MKGSFDPHATFRRAAVKHAKPREDRDFVVEQHEKNGEARRIAPPVTLAPVRWLGRDFGGKRDAAGD